MFCRPVGSQTASIHSGSWHLCSNASATLWYSMTLRLRSIASKNTTWQGWDRSCQMESAGTSRMLNKHDRRKRTGRHHLLMTRYSPGIGRNRGVKTQWTWNLLSKWKDREKNHPVRMRQDEIRSGNVDEYARSCTHDGNLKEIAGTGTVPPTPSAYIIFLHRGSYLPTKSSRVSFSARLAAD